MKMGHQQASLFHGFCYFLPKKNHLFPQISGEKPLKKFPLRSNIFSFRWENYFQKGGGINFYENVHPSYLHFLAFINGSRLFVSDQS